MSGTEFTPTDGQLRMAWIEKRWNSQGQLRSEGSDAEFDRAIAVHDERVREQTLRDFLSYRMLPSDVREYVSEYLAAGREAF